MTVEGILAGLTLALLVAGTAGAQAQDTSAPQKPCSAPEAAQFDFWVGDWNAAWEGGGGQNTITKEYDGCVIRENFRADPDSTGAALLGMSVSTWSVRDNAWKQTWVDNSGSYLDFTGGFADGKMTLAREFTGPKGKLVRQRMVWYNITDDAFDWNWERAIDDGEFQILWQIHYTRRK
ncbi:MAG TPA: hypothetical protein VLB27_03155 [candidate division Zixibacteria bacterium]|nr:hypothetical protein [candidate division Zixibacteria bacterium]